MIRALALVLLFALAGGKIASAGETLEKDRTFRDRDRSDSYRRLESIPGTDSWGVYDRKSNRTGTAERTPYGDIKVYDRKGNVKKRIETR